MFRYLENRLRRLCTAGFVYSLDCKQPAWAVETGTFFP
jgi:hypothetical protein